MVMMQLRAKETPEVAGATPCSATTFHIQEERCGRWIDYAEKDSAEYVVERIAALKIEAPKRVFRGIIRIKSDHLLPNDL